jgi:hypothetical protein
MTELNKELPCGSLVECYAISSFASWFCHAESTVVGSEWILLLVPPILEATCVCNQETRVLHCC